MSHDYHMVVWPCLVDGVEWEVYCILLGDLSSISGSESDSEGSEDAVQPDPAPQSSSPFIHFTSGTAKLCTLCTEPHLLQGRCVLVVSVHA